MPSKIKDRVGGLKIEVKSQKINLIAYKEVSGKVIVKASKRKRKQKGVTVFIKNTYYGQIDHPDSGALPPVPVFEKPTEKETKNKRRTVLREFAVGIGVKLKGSYLQLAKGPVELPITGVRTEVTIKVGNETKQFKTTKGTVPDG